MKVEITYLDGSQKILQITPFEHVAWDRYARENHLPFNPRMNGETGADTERFPLQTWQIFLAYAADTKALPAGTRPKFEEWAATLAGAEATDKPDSMGPTDAAPTPAAYAS